MHDRTTKRGSLACVGIGITLGSHLSPLARSHIEQADVVFVGASDGVVEQWIASMHPDVRSLQPFYQPGVSRIQTYRGMVDAILAEVRNSQRVCAAFYGHPGVFAWPAHRSLQLARAEGYTAVMEPGISAEDCLYADLGIDPGRFGCQHFETTQLMLYQRRIDPSAFLILWQAGVVGDRSLTLTSTATGYRELLVDVLAQDYPRDHEVIIYRAATLPVAGPRVRRLALAELPGAEIGMEDTLVLKPARPMQSNMTIRARLDLLDSQHTRSAPAGSLAGRAAPGVQERQTGPSLDGLDPDV